ncbi:MAG TPA: histidine phosphatase family protein [Candidatus Limnocylindria bacterium]|nr:histidine phosphatase family protein [Candidatus Limnocylindria bacterium]
MGSLILVRHATTDAAASGRNLGRRTDPDLSPEGHELARRLGATLRREVEALPHDDLRFVTSPATRCRRTIEPVMAALGGGPERLEVEPGLWEIDYGAWDGLTADECRQRDPELRARWEADPYATACPDGESGADVAERAFATLEPLEDWLAADRARCAIVVAHNHVNRLRLCALFGWPMREYRRRVSQDPGGYSIIGFGGDPPVIRRVNAMPAHVGVGTQSA